MATDATVNIRVQVFVGALVFDSCGWTWVLLKSFTHDSNGPPTWELPAPPLMPDLEEGCEWVSAGWWELGFCAGHKTILFLV